ncbi:MAG TPA: DUF2793 domain-containing protein [Rhizomicrobium sp.]|nr:DUF2793 domain-containing protein [Rhizomicrobium sp.]
MTDTPRTALPLLAAAQAQKHVTHNEALLQLDALLFARFLDRDLTAPPSSPTDGDTYLIHATATGDWLGKDGQIAFAVDGAWRFYAPFTGLAAYVVDEGVLLVFTGSAWADYASILNLQNVPLLGVDTTADTTNKFAVKSSALLFDNIGAGVQAKLNKHASTDTASLLYQTNYSGRAELGLSGDDDLHVKVSPDGASWFEGLRVARGSGLVSLIGDPTSALHCATKQYVDGLAKGFTTGSVLFAGASGAIGQDNAKLFWDDTNGRLGIGTASPDSILTLNTTGAAGPSPLSGTGFHTIASQSAGGRLWLWDVAAGNPTLRMRRTNGTFAAPSGVLANQNLATVAADGHDGTGFAASNTGGLNFFAAENFSTGGHGTYFNVQTTPAGSTTIAEAFRVWDDKRIQGGGAYVDLSYSYQQPATGFAIAVSNTAGRLILDPAGTLASGTITLPAAPKDGQLLRLSTTQGITALTLAPATGQSVVGAPATLGANTSAEFTYRAANTTWYRTG